MGCLVSVRSHSDLGFTGDYADVQTDIFALGSAIYFIMTGHEVFPELDSLENDEAILSRFKQGIFPNDKHEHICYHITEKCWKQQYQSAGDVGLGLTPLQESVGNSAANSSVSVE